MPRLLSVMSICDDVDFCPILVAVAQNHSGIIPLDMFERLVHSADGRYRAVAAVSLGAVAGESTTPHLR